MTSGQRWKKRGVAPQQDKRDHYLALVAQGMNNSAACRAVGINQRTGTRRRYGRTVLNRVGEPIVYPSIVPAPVAVSARFPTVGCRSRWWCSICCSTTART